MQDFEIPTDLDELITPDRDGEKYRVQRVYKGAEIAKKLDGKFWRDAI